MPYDEDVQRKACEVPATWEVAEGPAVHREETLQSLREDIINSLVHVKTTAEPSLTGPPSANTAAAPEALSNQLELQIQCLYDDHEEFPSHWDDLKKKASAPNAFVQPAQLRNAPLPIQVRTAATHHVYTTTMRAKKELLQGFLVTRHLSTEGSCKELFDRLVADVAHNTFKGQQVL